MLHDATYVGLQQRVPVTPDVESAALKAECHEVALSKNSIMCPEGL